MLSGSGDHVPVLHVLVKIEVLTPFDQAVNLLLEVALIDVQEFFIVERIRVQLFELLLELG